MSRSDDKLFGTANPPANDGVLARLADKPDGKLVLVTNETVDNILSLTRLNGIFATAPRMDEALQMVEAHTS